MSGTHTDITNRKQSEEALKERERSYRTLTENLPGIVYRVHCRENNRMQFFNNYLVNLTGYNEEELTKGDICSIDPLIIAEDRDTIFSEVKGAIKDRRSFSIEYRITHKDGTRRFFCERGQPIFDNNGLQYIEGIILDVTEQKYAEEALKESESRYRNIFDHAIEGIFQTTPEGRYRSLNPAFASMFGYDSPDEMKAAITDIGEQLYVNPEDRKRLIEMMNASKGMVREFEVQLKRKDGSLFWVSINAQIIKKEGADSPYLEGTCLDITERKLREEEHRTLQERLQRAEKMEALGLLAGGVAHDLNNTLGILVGYSELLYEGLDEANPLREDARNIILGGEQAAAIIQDLLALARRGVQTKAVTNMNKIVTEYLKSAEFLKLTSFHPEIRIKSELEEGLLKIHGSRVHLSKTLMNLVSNAVEAMTSGGEVIIRTENRYLDRPVSGYDKAEEGDYVVLTISDEGEGITDDDMKRIFEPFYTKKVMGRSGTGLGLSVVWGTVKDHSGYIDVQSRRGQGTTFTLYFPVTHEKEMEQESITPTDEYMGRGERILVIDDVEGQRDLAVRILQKLNYNVTSVSSGEEAVDYLKDKYVDLIVLDMIMDPGIDGFETYRRISEIKPQQKAVIVSGFAETEQVKMAQSLGAGTFVKKPYIRERIGMAVRKELDRSA